MKRGEDYIGVGVGAAIFNDDGKVFVMKRGEKAKNERGKWDFPGGAVEFGETLAVAIKREIQEEFEIDIDVNELLGVVDHIIEAEGQHWVAPTFICSIASGSPRITEPDKCSEIGWFTFDEVEKLPLTITTQHDLEALRKKYPNGYRM